MTEITTVTQRRTSWVRVWDWTKSIAIALVLWFLLSVFVVQAFHIPSGSMESTLMSGDFLFANKVLYGAEIPLIHRRLPAIREPRRLDIVIFDSVEEPGVNVVKRVIGLPGDTIAMRLNTVYINDTPLEEPYKVVQRGSSDVIDPMMRWQRRYLAYAAPRRPYRPTLRSWGPLVVPADSFFVMGDNRDVSYDSRYWGFLGRDRIRGRPMLVYFSYDKHTAPFPMITGVRWHRLLSMPQ